jgi:flagellar transcriptional activator FlhC
LYLEQCAGNDLEPALSLTRAWRLIKFVEAGMLKYASCRKCEGEFVVRDGDLTSRYVCGCCQPPARAGKTRKAARERLAA